MPLPRTPEVHYMGGGGKPQPENPGFSHQQMKKNEARRQTEQPGNQQGGYSDQPGEWFGAIPPRGVQGGAGFSTKQMQMNEQRRQNDQPGYSNQQAGRNEQQGEWFGAIPPRDAPGGAGFSNKQMQMNEQRRQNEQQQPGQQRGYNQQPPANNAQQGEWFGAIPPRDAPGGAGFSNKQMQMNEQRRQQEQQQPVEQSPRYYDQRPGQTEQRPNYYEQGPSYTEPRPAYNDDQDKCSVHSDRQNAGNGGQNSWRQPDTDRPQEEPGRPKQPINTPTGQTRQQIDRVDERADELNRSVEKFESDWQAAPGRVEGAESAFAASGPQLEQIKETRANQSARIHQLEQAVVDIKRQNDYMRGELTGRGFGAGGAGGYGQDDRDYRQGEYPPQQTNQSQYYNTQGQENRGNGYGDDAGQGQQEPEGERRMRWYETERIQRPHRRPNSYLGYEKFITPQMATTYRREAANLEYAKTGERPGQKPQQCGGLYLIRFHGSGLDSVRPALRELQTIMYAHKGYPVGLVPTQNIVVLEGGEWSPPRHDAPRPNFPIQHKAPGDAMATLWFESQSRACDFAANSHKNRFRNIDFPTPQGAEMVYLAMNTPLYNTELSTLLVMTINNAKRYPPASFANFEQEVRDRLSNFNCIPLVVSTVLQPDDVLKQGSRSQLIRPYSKVYVSRFASLQDVAAVWEDRVMQDARNRNGLTGDGHVFAFSLCEL